MVADARPGLIVAMLAAKGVAVDAAAGIQEKRVWCVAAMEGAQARARTIQAPVSFFVRTDDAQALAATRFADWDLARGHLRETPRGMPMGMRLEGRPYDEGTVLRAGNAFRRTTDRHPPAPQT